MSFPITVDQKTAFLERLAQTCNITASAEAAGISRGYLYQLRDRDPEFAAAWDAALVRIADAVRDAIVDEAITGAQIFNDEGQLVGTRRNTALLTKLAIKLGILDPDRPGVAVQTNINNAPVQPVLSDDHVAGMRQLLKDIDARKRQGEVIDATPVDINEVEL